MGEHGERVHAHLPRCTQVARRDPLSLETSAHLGVEPRLEVRRGHRVEQTRDLRHAVPSQRQGEVARPVPALVALLGPGAVTQLHLSVAHAAQVPRAVIANGDGAQPVVDYPLQPYQRAAVNALMDGKGRVPAGSVSDDLLEPDPNAPFGLRTDNDADFVTPDDMLAELREDNQRLAGFMRATHELCDEHGDVATASLLENWIDEAEQRAWFLFESGRTSV